MIINQNDLEVAAQAKADELMPFVWPKNKHGEEIQIRVGQKNPPNSRKHKIAQQKLIDAFKAGAAWANLKLKSTN